MYSNKNVHSLHWQLPTAVNLIKLVHNDLILFNFKHWLFLTNRRFKIVLEAIFCCLQGVTKVKGGKSRGPGDAL